MAKFKKGDRVRLTTDREEYGLVAGDIGVLREDDDGAPFVDFERIGDYWAVDSDDLELVGDAATEATGTFKVGDRVRYSDAKCVGVGTITENNSDTTWFVKVEDKDCDHAPFDKHTTRIFDENDLQQVAAAEQQQPAKFKVGDRVRSLKEDGSGGFVVGGEYTVSDVYFEYGWRIRVEKDSVGSTTNGWGEENFEPATLRIQSGKFYKTRDGRKVGPMRRNLSGDYWCVAVGEEYYYDDGRLSRVTEEPGDLIAEWPSDTTVAPASNDNEPQAAESRFKVGDPIRVIDPSGFRFGTKVGDRGVVTEDYDGGSFVDINLNHETDGTISQIARPSQIELVTTTPAIVCLLENGQPLPSTRPFVHANADAASDEAARLAKKHPGKAFAVYEYKRAAKVEPVYAHEWQRLAAGGDTVDARRMLQKTGLTGIQASRVVQEFVAAA